ncbi:hypothetical protein J3R30DRAFT_624619 [Lentinula aciculospora]|uniref:START domain-containing protein n=1 Tax=Lentinula aciculospora TaxID=153920 RepID=A0A9W9A5L2_9AGAR|nr:hypothetical protein J3R30DRAFT_624619 [Lentinula aciculospora]
MSDGSRLRESWNNSLNDAETRFKQLLSASSSEWKRVSNSTDSTVNRKGKTRLSSLPELFDVIVHRHSNKSGDDIYRLLLDVPADEEMVTLEPWRAVLTTPELRQEWDPAVIDAHLVEMFDQDTRISKTNFTLGWPASPRDAVTISRTMHDATTVIDISTSLPRSSDEPAYLRPSPPYVRSNISLLAWCIQHIKPSQPPPESKRKSPLGGRIRVTCFWQHDLRAIWNIGSSSIVQQLSTMVIGLMKTVTKRTTRIPKLVGYGHGVSIEKIRFQIDREALTIEYSVIPEDDNHPDHTRKSEDFQSIRDQQRLTRAIECTLPAEEGWDVQLTTKASSQEVEKLPWTADATRSTSYLLLSNSPLDQVVLRLAHAPLIDDHSVLRVKVVIEISGPSSGLRLNGVPQSIKDFEEQRDPSSYVATQSILPDVGSGTDISAPSSSSMHGSSATSLASSSSAPPLIPVAAERSTGAEKTILSRVKRNYIYFSSLLQEPEAKWKRTTEARGVTITQLDSIDPTLVVYRAEATFVGVGLWDLYSAVVSPGTRNFWDKQHEDAILLEDVNELTELWHMKTKPAWPINGRDSVVLKTVYKSPTTIHVFSFSADDPHLFPNIPPVDPNVIRTQVDLQGWAIEALSPNTTLLTLLEQSDPKGWTNKTSIPTQMINALAGIGEFAIKCGGPPIVTRLTGAKANDLRYDHERFNFRLEYEPSARRRMVASSPIEHPVTLTLTSPDDDSGTPTSPVIECEIRCDMDTWGQSLDIVVDPPPQSISCLRRHRLSDEGGGLWMTITHDAVFVDDERLQVIVRRGPGKEKGLVMVNGAKTSVDVEELPEHEIKTLIRRKRVKPLRIPLDQPPVMGVIRKRRAEWDAVVLDSLTSESVSNTGGASSTLPKVSSPLARFFTYAVDQATATTQQTIAAISPSAVGINDASLSSSKLPMQYVLDVLAWTQNYQCSTTPQAGWTLIGDKGLSIRRKLVSDISPVIPIHKGEKVIEGISAEELAAVITEPDCRKRWDDRFDSATMFESFGSGCKTSFIVSKSGFPFRDRGFYIASVVARAQGSPLTSRRNTDSGPSGSGPRDASSRTGCRNAIYCVSTSFSPDSVSQFSVTRYNQYGLPIGRVYIDAWILETLDPYTKENYAVPSSKCTRLVAVDYAGSLPAAVNSLINATIPRAILNVESYVKSISSLPVTRLPAAGIVLADRKDEDVEAETYVKFGWKLRKRDECRVLLRTNYDSGTKIYTSFILVNYPSGLVSGKSAVGDTASRSNVSLSPTRQSHSQQQVTPRASRVELKTLPESLLNNPSLATIQGMPSSSSSVLSSPKIETKLLPSPTTLSFSNMSSVSSVSSMAHSSTSSTISSFNNSNNFNLAQAMPGQRERTASVSSSGFRGRSSSAFTLKGEVKHTTDLLVGEIVIDSKLYPRGYMVILTSKTRKMKGKEEVPKDREGRGESKSPSRTNGSSTTRGSANLNATPINLDSLFSNSSSYSNGAMNVIETSILSSESSSIPSASNLNTGIDSESSEHQLPLSYTLHTIPLSPLHSSGSGIGMKTNADSTYTYDYESESPTRHLLKLTLPTAQYFVSTIQDPLTGETQVAPPKPRWLVEMEEGGAIVCVEVKPLDEDAGIGKGKVRVVNGRKNVDASKTNKNDKDKEGKVWNAVRNAWDVAVVGEKESLTTLGREELLDDRVSKMSVLSRATNELEALPDDLKTPVGVTDSLLDPEMKDVYGPPSAVIDGTDRQLLGDSTAEDSDSNAESGVGDGDEQQGMALEPPETPRPSLTQLDNAGGGFLLNFLPSYPNLLWRFTTSGTAANIATAGTKSSSGSSGGNLVTVGVGGKNVAVMVPKPRKASNNVGRPTVINPTRLYPVSTLMIIALIAFLIGSLFRSLLSPADFVYVVKDLGDAAEAQVLGGTAGWREMRRLFEIKYVFGGWDFQVAVVRRH